MTGQEALSFVLEEIKKDIQANANTGQRNNAMKISWELAIDLCKLTRDQIGDLAELTFVEGPSALIQRGLFGYGIDIDYKQEGHVVEFGVR